MHTVFLKQFARGLFFSTVDLGSELFEGMHHLTRTFQSMLITFLIGESSFLFGDHVPHAFCPEAARLHVPALTFVQG